MKKDKSIKSGNKIPTYRCLVCGKINQTGVCPYCGRVCKYVGLSAPFKEK